MNLEFRRERGFGPLLLVALIALLWFQYGDVIRLPLLFDDYAILKKVHGRSLIDLWMPRELLYGWYRPWSRETHFWLIDRLSGAQPVAFHAANLVLWLACTATFHALARRLAGSAAATAATCGLAVFGGWSGTLLWASGAQESWMVLFSLLSVSAFLSRRVAWATAFLGFALLSKETACVVPGILLLAGLLDGGDAKATARRIAPLAVVTIAWAVLHPTLRLSFGRVHTSMAVLATNAVRTLLSFVNLERIPKPEHGWLDAIGAALPVLIVLSIVLGWTLRSGAPTASKPDGSAAPAKSVPPAAVGPRWTTGRVVAFGLGWCALASLPPIMSGSSWAPYYGVLAACGAWIAAAAWLTRWPLLSFATIMMAATLQASAARTPAWEWGAASFQRRAAALTSGLERSMRLAHPTLPPHTRVYLELVPQGLGAGENWFDPVVQVWYRDTTIHVERLSAYRLRSKDAMDGPDLFFGFVPPTSWVEIHHGAENVTDAMRRNPYWTEDHTQLALTMGQAGDWRGAASEIEKLATTFPRDPQYATNLAYCLRQMGDTLAAARWQQRADSLLTVTSGGRAR